MNNNYFDQITKFNAEKIDELCKDAFLHFHNKEGEVLYDGDFRLLLHELFTDFNAERKDEDVSLDSKIREMFNFFDMNADGIIDVHEFQRMWNIFIIPILKPRCALIVIDVQNDFIDGSLAIRNCPAGQDGLDVVPTINDINDKVSFQAVFYTYDWHPEDHISFIDNVHLRKFHESSPICHPKEAKVYDTVIFEGPPPIEQKLWPAHCVQKSWGSQLHPHLKIIEDAVFIYKGSSSEIDSYSAFWDNQKRSQTNLTDELKSRGITDVFICGLAYDYCVGFTALHSLEHGFRTTLIDDACRGVADNDINKMKEKLISNYAVIETSNNILHMVNGHIRKWQLGYFKFMSIQKC